MSDYSSQTVAQLKEVLKQRNLSTDGKKADLVQRLTESDSQAAPSASQPGELDEPVEESNAQGENTESAELEETNGDLTVIPPSEETQEETREETKPEPKVLSPEERKQLAVDLLTKKVKRAEKFGDEAAAEAARKDLARVEKFGVELGTGLAREIGILDKNFNEGLRAFNPKQRNNKRGFKKGGNKRSKPSNRRFN